MNGKQPTAVARARPLPADTRTAKGYYARSVGAYVPKVVATAFEKYGFHTAEIMTSWETIVGADLARLTRPESIKWPRGAKGRVVSDDDDARTAGATLILASNPAFALEVSYRSQEIVERINRYFGYRAIAQLRVLQTPAATPSTNAEPRRNVPSNGQVAMPRTTEGLGGALEALADNIKAARQAR